DQRGPAVAARVLTLDEMAGLQALPVDHELRHVDVVVVRQEVVLGSAQLAVAAAVDLENARARRELLLPRLLLMPLLVLTALLVLVAALALLMVAAVLVALVRLAGLRLRRGLLALGWSGGRGLTVAFGSRRRRLTPGRSR